MLINLYDTGVRFDWVFEFFLVYSANAEYIFLLTKMSPLAKIFSSILSMAYHSVGIRTFNDC